MMFPSIARKDVYKRQDYEYKYEAAKSYFGKGQNTKAATILEELITIMKGTDKACLLYTSRCV